MSQSTTEEAAKSQKEPPFSEQEDSDIGEAGEQKAPESEEKDKCGEEREVSEGEERGGEDYKSKYYYLAAEMDNMRKRFERERENFVKYGNERILTGLIEVVDNLDRTLESLSADKDEKVRNIVVGIEMVHKQFLEVLKQNGLEAVETEGKTFDPNYHEAIGQQESEDKKEDEIVNVYQKGYVLSGRLLRAAKVVIAKKKQNKS